MMYLSKGLLVQETGGDFCVSHGGRLFVLGHEMAALWSAARLAPQAVPDAKAHYIERLPAWPLPPKKRATWQITAYCAAALSARIRKGPVRIQGWMAESGLGSNGRACGLLPVN